MKEHILRKQIQVFLQSIYFSKAAIVEENPYEHYVYTPENATAFMEVIKEKKPKKLSSFEEILIEKEQTSYEAALTKNMVKGYRLYSTKREKGPALLTIIFTKHFIFISNCMYRVPASVHINSQDAEFALEELFKKLEQYE